jgi:hypothetical protein
VLQQQAAQDRADRHAQTHRASPHADGAPPFARVEDVGDDRQGGRQDGGAADAHERAGRDQLGRVLGVRRNQRRQPEEHQADDQDQPAAVPVTEHPGGEQQPGEDQGVGVDGPFQVALAGAQSADRVGDGAQRDVEHGVVEDDHQQADDEHPEDRPTARVARVRAGIWSHDGSPGFDTELSRKRTLGHPVPIRNRLVF